MAVELRNPHSVLAVFEHRPSAVVDVQLSPGSSNPAWETVANLAAQHRVPVRRTSGRQDQRRKNRRDQSPGRTGANVATIKECPAVEISDLFQSVEPDCCDIWLALDQIQDPHNLGAIFRAAAFFGIRGIVMTRDRSAPLSATAYDVASGGVECVPFASPPNLSRAIQQAKDAGLWVLGTSEHAEKPLADVDRKRPWLLVLGNEEKGLRRLTREQCDELCCIPAKGGVGSLNVSVAAGVMMAGLTGAMDPGDSSK